MQRATSSRMAIDTRTRQSVARTAFAVGTSRGIGRAVAKRPGTDRLWLSRVLNTLPGLVWAALPDGHIDFLNRRWCEYTGLGAGQACGQGWHATIHPEDLPELAACWRSIVLSGKPADMEARLRRFDGEYRWFLISVNPMRNNAGQIVKWYGVNTDIDDRKRAEEKLRRSNAFLAAGQKALDRARSELTQLARVASLGMLTASIAHEVDQPLSGIITNAGTCLRMLSADPPNVDGARETARRTIRDGNRASDVVSRLRTLYSKKDLVPESIDLNEAAEEVISLSLHELQRNRVILRHELADDLPPVAGDRIQLQQAILILVRNASDAMSTVDDRPRELLIRTERDETDRVRLSVKDAGVGFTPEASKKLFDAFYTTKSNGMGIGLSIGRSIIEAHQGRLWATANRGPGDPFGATFSFSIPCLSENRAEAEDTLNQADLVTGAAA
jgi:PAS domain S-box-containing protein